MPLVRAAVRRVRAGVRRRWESVKDLARPWVRGEASPAESVAIEVPAVDAAASHGPAPTPPDVPSVPSVPGIDRAAVEALFEDMVRPALQSDGGDITLVKVEQNDVYVELVGACHSCPSAIVTMEQGIERLLREEFPTFGRLVRVDAPDSSGGHDQPGAPA